MLMKKPFQMFKSIERQAIVFNLGVVLQSAVDGTAQHPVVELAGLFTSDIAEVGDGFRSGELHILEDERAAIASHGTHFLTFLHTKEGTNDVGFDTEIAQHT